MVSDLGARSTETGLDVRGIVRLFGALQSNGFASGIYLHPAMTNHSCRYVDAHVFCVFTSVYLRYYWVCVCGCVSLLFFRHPSTFVSCL